MEKVKLTHSKVNNMFLKLLATLTLFCGINAPCWGQSVQSEDPLPDWAIADSEQLTLYGSNAPVLRVRVADGTPVRHGFGSAYRASYRRPLVGVGRVYIKGRLFESRSRSRGRGVRLPSLNGPGFIGRATFRPQGLF